MSEWYSRADRERIAQGLEPLPHSELTQEDYKDLLAFALNEAVEGSPAKDMIADASVEDLNGKYAGITTSDIGADGKMTGKYDVTIDWGTAMQEKAAGQYGQAYMAQRFSTVFHEVHHVEQKAMVAGMIPVESKADKEVVTQMTVNDLYPTVYKRGYKNTISEVDADVEGLAGALEFFDAHPELKERYGFDFRKQIMLTDEYDVLENTHQLTDATPEELLDGMRNYRDGIYDDPWLPDTDGRVTEGNKMGTSETSFMNHLQETHGVDWTALETMDNDERNALLIQNAMETIDSPDYKVASNLRAYRYGVVMTARYDEEIVYENNLNELVGPETGIDVQSKPEAELFSTNSGEDLVGLSPSDLNYSSFNDPAYSIESTGAANETPSPASSETVHRKQHAQPVLSGGPPMKRGIDRVLLAEMRLGIKEILKTASAIFDDIDPT